MKKSVLTARASIKVEQHPNIVKATADLVAAQDALAKAEAIRAQADKRVADAVSLVNKTQRAFDDTVTMIKGGAPAASDWFAKSRKR